MCHFKFVVGLGVDKTVWDLYEKLQTVKVSIARASKEAELTLLNEIVNKVEKFYHRWCLISVK